MTRRSSPAGFTLIELMVVVAVLAILAAVALPKFAGLINKSREAQAKYGLGSVRSSLSLYYADNQFFPSAGGFNDAVLGRYIDKIPAVLIPPPGDHPRSETVGDYTGTINDTGGWLYDITGTAGRILIDCSHQDQQGRTWSTW